MAELITPGVFRAQAVFQGGSGFARDRYVNTFHFIDKEFSTGTVGGDFGSYGDELGERVREFYLEPVETGARVGGYLSPYVLRDFEVRVYDLGNTEDPRPVWVTEHTLPAPSGSDSLPFETAISASYYSFRNVKRQRGRIYIGPLGGLVMENIGGVPMVKPLVCETISQAMKRLSGEGVMDRADWCVFSPTDNEAKPITGGWVDNEFDTIRARQPRATSRSTWSA